MQEVNSEVPMQIGETPHSENTTVTSKKENKSKTWIFVIVSTIVFLCTVVGTYFYFTFYAKTDDSPTPLPIEKKVAPKDWESYESRYYNYKFSYPPDWTITTKNDTHIQLYNGFSGPGEGGVWGFVDVTMIIDYPEAEKLFYAHYQSEPGPITTTSGKKAFKFSNVEIGGVKGIYYSEVQPSQGQYMLTSYYEVYEFVRGKYLYTIRFSTDSKRLNTDNLPIYNTIMGTFQFLR